MSAYELAVHISAYELFSLKQLLWLYLNKNLIF